jgi:tRNA pseudouridine32 synthase/23S rRNA pseudouridine746 synthase
MFACPPILYSHPGFVVIRKPSGLLSVPGIGPSKQVCAVSLVRDEIAHATGPMMVHRLDMETSGLMVIALTREHQAALSRAFEQRLVQKAYVALLDCSQREPLHDEGLIDLPMRLDVENRPYQIVDFVLGKAATTRYRVLSREVDRARVRFEPLTGRTHQLRVHAATPARLLDALGTPRAGGLGCAILGDGLYGNKASAPRLMLHASELSFRDPLSGVQVACVDVPDF